MQFTADFNLDDALSDFIPPASFRQRQQEAAERDKRLHRQRVASGKRLARIGPKIAARNRRNRIKQQQSQYDKSKKQYNKMNFDDITDKRPATSINTPYDFGTPQSRHAEPRDKTNAANEHDVIVDPQQDLQAYQAEPAAVSGEIDLFDRRLFPGQNSKKYSDKSGREFLADFTHATRGQLVVCMSRLAYENPREFARLWVEMEKFNTPQQAAVDINANINARAGLYAKLEAMSTPSEPQPADLDIINDLPDDMGPATDFDQDTDQVTDQDPYTASNNIRSADSPFGQQPL